MATERERKERRVDSMIAAEASPLSLFIWVERT